MTGKEFYLDWAKDRLYGWESVKSDLTIDSIVKGIEAGADFPPVSVVNIGENEWRIKVGEDGGHCRSVGHYVAGAPLKSVESGAGIPSVTRIPIENIKLVDDDSLPENRRHEFRKAYYNDSGQPYL